MGSRLAAHESFGSIILTARAGEIVFACSDCGRPYARLNKQGLRVESRHAGGPHINRIKLPALKRMIAEVEKE